jgi:integrase
LGKAVADRYLNNVAIDATEVSVAQAADLPGAAHLELVEGVAEQAVLQAMLAGWARQQQTRFLNDRATISPRLSMVRRLVEFTNTYPWQWRPADAEEFIAHLRSPNRSRPIAMSTGRGYETTLALFMSYLTDRRYGWPEECERRFGTTPQQIFTEDNRVTHVAEYEGQPGRRPLTFDEVQALFDAVDASVEEAQSLGRKGSLTTRRDAALLKTIYAFGLRRNEARMLDLGDLRRAPKMPQFRQYGGLYVRYGKASRGSPPKRRTVLTIQEMDWIVEVRPLFSPGCRPSLICTRCDTAT